MIEGIRNGAVARDRTIAMLIIFAFNILFWMFYEQAGNSFTFLADQIVDRVLGGFVFPTAWFQSVSALAVIVLAPVVAWVWVWMARRNLNPSVPRKFGLGLLFNGLAFLLLMYALSNLVSDSGKIPFWTLISVYVIQVVGELVPVADRLVDGDQAGAGATRRAGDGRMVPLDGNRQQSVRHLRERVSGETGMTTDVGACRLHVRLLGPGRLWRRAVHDRAADPAPDARREVNASAQRPLARCAPQRPAAPRRR